MAWARDREARIVSAKASWTLERRERASHIQHRVLAERGYHLARGKETGLERRIREHFEELGFEVKTQKQSRDKILGAKRYFDVFVPALNLIVEADGEFWHTRSERIEIDVLKEEAARFEGYNFIRISDAEVRGAKASELAQLLSVEPTEATARSASIIAARRAKLQAQV